MSLRFGIIIVTHNSQKVLDLCIQAIERQTYAAEEIVIVDSGSDDHQYLDDVKSRINISIVKVENIGFAKANNLGLRTLAKEMDIVLFLNPDTFLTPTFIKQANEVFQRQKDISVLSGKLSAYNLQENAPSGRIDSCGIFRKWYGRWYDRGQGEVDDGRYGNKQFVPALCGALLCLRTNVLDQCGWELFDPDFFLYKEDIELSLRLRQHGYSLLYHPELIAYHCRGWQKSRKKIDKKTKIIASKNEILLYQKHPSPYLIWALFKYFLVVVFKL